MAAYFFHDSHRVSAGKAMAIRVTGRFLSPMTKDESIRPEIKAMMRSATDIIMFFDLFIFLFVLRV